MQYSNESEFWHVGLSYWGDWHVRMTPHDKQPVDGDDTLIELLQGDIKTVKIEFDGVFVRDYTKSHFDLVTEDLPWLFVLMNDGRLYTKKAQADMNTLILLDTEVSDMDTIRGWVNSTKELDQGLICAYIKDGVAYYAEYHQVGGQFVWEKNFRLDETDLSEDKTRIQAFRLNDYRIAICVYSSDTQKLYISNRLYIGGTLSPIFFQGAVQDPDFTMLNPSLASDPNYYSDLNPVLKLDNSGETTVVRLHCTYPFVSFDPRFTTFNDPEHPAGSSYLSKQIDESTGDFLLTLNVKLPTEYSHVKFSSRELNRLRFRVTDYCKPTLPARTFETIPRSEKLNEHFQGSVLSVSGSMTVIKKRNYKYRLEETFEGSVLSTSASSTLIPLGKLKSSDSESFYGPINSVSTTLTYEFSGSVIG